MYNLYRVCFYQVYLSYKAVLLLDIKYWGTFTSLLELPLLTTLPWVTCASMNTRDCLHNILNSFRKLGDFLSGFSSQYYLRNASTMPIPHKASIIHILIEFKVRESKNYIARGYLQLLSFIFIMEGKECFSSKKKTRIVC